MTTVIELVRSQLRQLHQQLDRGIEGLTDEQWHFVPDGKGNSIAFIAWHYARTEDNIVRFVIQNRRPTVWMDGGWAEKLGLPPVAQGTGMPVEEAHGLRIGDPLAFRTYVQGVWASTEEYFAGANEAELEALVTVRPLGEMPKLRAVAQVGVTHGFAHAGEIQHLRTIQDLSGMGF